MGGREPIRFERHYYHTEEAKEISKWLITLNFAGDSDFKSRLDNALVFDYVISDGMMTASVTFTNWDGQVYQGSSGTNWRNGMNRLGRFKSKLLAQNLACKALLETLRPLWERERPIVTYSMPCPYCDDRVLLENYGDHVLLEHFEEVERIIRTTRGEDEVLRARRAQDGIEGKYLAGKPW